MRLLERLTRPARELPGSPIRAARADLLVDAVRYAGGQRLALDGYTLSRLSDQGLEATTLDTAIDDAAAAGRIWIGTDADLGLVVLSYVGAAP